MAEWAAPAMIDTLSGSRAVRGSLPRAALELWPTRRDFSTMSPNCAARRRNGLRCGREELCDLLVDVAIGSPAICALRALRRIAPQLAWDDPACSAPPRKSLGLFARSSTCTTLSPCFAVAPKTATGIAYSPIAQKTTFRLFSTNMRTISWMPKARRPHGRGSGIGCCPSDGDTLSIRPSQIDVDDPKVEREGFTIHKFQMRGRFAMRLADYRDEEGAVARLGGVRDAFNSPFRPFVLATTSVGQEGLDFHPYCYRVYHWNSPAIPLTSNSARAGFIVSRDTLSA